MFFELFGYLCGSGVYLVNLGGLISCRWWECVSRCSFWKWFFWFKMLNGVNVLRDINVEKINC